MRQLIKRSKSDRENIRQFNICYKFVNIISPHFIPKDELIKVGESINEIDLEKSMSEFTKDITEIQERAKKDSNMWFRLILLLIIIMNGYRKSVG